jgi:copper resistance protein D
MIGFIDVVLRGLALAGASVALGGIVFARVVLGGGRGIKPDRATVRALWAAALGAGLTAAAQLAIVLASLNALVDAGGAGEGSSGWPLALYLDTAFARAAVVRVLLGGAVALLAWRLTRGAASRVGWTALVCAGIALVGSSAWVSHAMARLDHRAVLITLDAVHQLAAAVWVGGLVHLVLYASCQPRSLEPVDGAVAPRFSRLVLWAVATLIAAGVALATAYVGDAHGLLGTAYGVMVLTKLLLLVAALALATANRALVRRLPDVMLTRRFTRFVEVEMGLAVTVLFAAASLTSLPPAVDVTIDRASLAEVGARFAPAAPHLASPSIDDLLRVADPLMAPSIRRTAVERAWSEYNHHWSGLFVLAMATLAALEASGLRAARHWPLLFLGLGAWLFARTDPRAWPLGPAGFWESLVLPDVLQHRVFVLFVVALGLFEWSVRTERLRARPWAYVFPSLCAVGGGLLLTHSHAMFNLKEEFLTEVTHAPIGILGAFAGWSRWLELRLPEAAPTARRLWVTCLVGVGLILLFYRES